MKLRRISVFVATILLFSCTRQPPSTPTGNTSPTSTPTNSTQPNAAPVTSHRQATAGNHASTDSKKAAAQHEPAKPATQTPPAAASTAVKSPNRAPLDLSLSTNDDTPMFDSHFDATQQNPYRTLFDLASPPRARNFSVGGDLFWDEEKLKQPEVNYLDALKGGEISIEIKTR